MGAANTLETTVHPPSIPGVHFRHLPHHPSEAREARERSRLLVAAGVSYGDRPSGEVPWLFAVDPFYLDAPLHRSIERLGGAVFALLDAVQALYREGEPSIRRMLDWNVPEDLRGLQLDRPAVTFRLDLMIERNQPRITEIEEIYGNVGKMAAMQRAYGVNNDALFDGFAGLGLEAIYADDALPTYFSELDMLRLRLETSYGLEVPVRKFSAFHPGQRGAVWRFCKTRDLEQYDPALRRTIVRSACTFVNPLFHGYGMKTLLALPFLEDIGSLLRERVGAETFGVLRAGIPRCRFMEPDAPPEAWEEASRGHKNLVLKVVDCADHPEFTWGSRGVFFGDRSAARWRKTLQAAALGRMPGHPDTRNVLYMVSDLVESDRFDIPFLHPTAQSLVLMTNARVRLTPIFWRSDGQVRLMAGHASFVNTSRKVHLGTHSACAPLDWARDGEKSSAISSVLGAEESARPDAPPVGS